MNERTRAVLAIITFIGVGFTIVVCNTLQPAHIADASTVRGETVEAKDQPFWVLLEDARITNYSEADSCHYPDGHGGCLTASGTVATAGRTAACPREIPMGSTFIVNGHEWTCEDRYAKWVQEKFGDTYDLFIGYGEKAYEEAIAFGTQTHHVRVVIEP